MKIVQDSAEHHFLTFLEKLKNEPGGWIGHHYALSQTLNHDEIISVPAHIKGKLYNLQKDSDAFVKELAAAAAPFARIGGIVFQFADGDVIFLAGPKNETERDGIQSLFTAMAARAGARLASQNNLAKDIYNYEKLADRKFITARRMTAYAALSESSRTQSIPLRRDRRSEGVVLLVEDDRFTASFAANILNKDYDLVHAKTGEDAIISYIEHAPDMVLLDIHLPGLNGHETLRAIKKADTEAAVIMLSVDTVKTNIVGAAQGGALGFLKKPFSKDRLLAAVLQSPHIKGTKANRGRP